MPWSVGPPDTRTKLDDLATPDDNRDLNATILRHGLLPKLSGSASDVLNGKGEWGAPGAAGSLTSVIDSLFTIVDDVTPAKVGMFQNAGLSVGTHTYAFPPSTAGTTVTLAALDLAQTFTQPQIIDPGAVGDVPLKLVGQAGQTGNLFQVLDSANAVLAGINAAGDMHGGVLTTDSLVLRSNDGGTNTRARVILSNTPDVRFDIEAGSVDPLVLSLGLASGTLTGTALSLTLVDSGTNNSTLEIDNRGGLTLPVALTVWRSLISSVANQTEWRDEANAIMSRIRSDGAFIGPVIGAVRQKHTWCANGPYRVDTDVDGLIIIPSAMTITEVWIARTTAGSSSDTIVDLHKNGTTMYTTQANRPTINFADGDRKVQATLPDVLAVAAGDILTMDIDQIEGGTPQHLTLIVQGN